MTKNLLLLLILCIVIHLLYYAETNYVIGLCFLMCACYYL